MKHFLISCAKPGSRNQAKTKCTECTESRFKRVEDATEIARCDRTFLQLLPKSLVQRNLLTEADPGFLRGWGRQPITWPISPENCMKMKFWAGGRVLCPPPDPPMTHCNGLLTSTDNIPSDGINTKL